MPPSEALPQISKFTLFRTELLQIWIPAISHLPFLLIAPKAWVRVKVIILYPGGSKRHQNFPLGFHAACSLPGTREGIPPLKGG